MNTPEIKTNIEVGGVVLTEKAIARLKQLQERDNDGIDHMSKIIQMGIRAIVRNLDNFDPEEMKKIQSVLVDLSYVCDWIEDLEKP